MVIETTKLITVTGWENEHRNMFPQEQQGF